MGATDKQLDSKQKEDPINEKSKCQRNHGFERCFYSF